MMLVNYISKLHRVEGVTVKAVARKSGLYKKTGRTVKVLYSMHLL